MEYGFVSIEGPKRIFAPLCSALLGKKFKKHSPIGFDLTLHMVFFILQNRRHFHDHVEAGKRS
jgi:hypothetical protein